MIKQTRQPDRRRKPPHRGHSRVVGFARAHEGAAAVEFALICTLLFLILFGLINFGIIFSQQLTLNNAVREGARKAVVTNDGSNNRTCQGILDSTRNQLSGLAMNPADVAFKISTSGWSTSAPCTPQSPVVNGFSKTVTPATQGNIPCTGSSTSTGIGSWWSRPATRRAP